MQLAESIKEFFNKDEFYLGEDKVVIIRVLTGILLMKSNTATLHYIKLVGDIENGIEDFDIDIFEKMMLEMSESIMHDYNRGLEVFGNDLTRDILYLRMVIKQDEPKKDMLADS